MGSGGDMIVLDANGKIKSGAIAALGPLSQRSAFSGVKNHEKRSRSSESNDGAIAGGGCVGARAASPDCFGQKFTGSPRVEQKEKKILREERQQKKRVEKNLRQRKLIQARLSKQRALHGVVTRAMTALRQNIKSAEDAKSAIQSSIAMTKMLRKMRSPHQDKPIDTRMDPRLLGQLGEQHKRQQASSAAHTK